MWSNSDGSDDESPTHHRRRASTVEHEEEGEIGAPGPDSSGEAQTKIEDINVNGTHYDLFNLSNSASKNDIDAAYRATLTIVMNDPSHPLHAGHLNRLSEAYKTLSNPQSRTNYDEATNREKRSAKKLVIWKLSGKPNPNAPGCFVQKVGEIGPRWVFNQTKALNKLTNDRQGFLEDMEYMRYIYNALSLSEIQVHRRAVIYKWINPKPGGGGDIGFARMDSGEELFVIPKNFHRSTRSVAMGDVIEFTDLDDNVSPPAKRHRQSESSHRHEMKRLPLDIIRVKEGDPASGYARIDMRQIYNGFAVMGILSSCGGMFDNCDIYSGRRDDPDESVRPTVRLINPYDQFVLSLVTCVM
jgi:hypothetical protein